MRYQSPLATTGKTVVFVFYNYILFVFIKKHQKFVKHNANGLMHT